MYWIIDSDNLSTFFNGIEFELKNTKSDSNDDCHYDLIGLKDSQSEKFFKSYCKPPNLRLCEGDTSLDIDDDTHQRLSELYEFF